MMNKQVSMRLGMTALAAAGLAMAIGSTALAHEDILVFRNAENQLQTGTYDFDSSQAQIGVRVYEGELKAPFYTSSDPGFNALPQGSLPAGAFALSPSTALGFTIKAFSIGSATSNLFYWDAADEDQVDFQPVPSGYSLTLSKAPFMFFNATADGSTADVAGFTIDLTNASGGLHKHLDFTLGYPGASPADGFYMVALTLSMAGLQTSDPFWIIFGVGSHSESAHHEAIEWVEANLVPEPTTAVLLGVLGAGLMLRRRRKEVATTLH